MKHIVISPEVTGAISEMRIPGTFGASPEELQDGNMLPSLCRAAGEGACKNACQLAFIDAEPVECAEQNIQEAIGNFGVDVENFVLVKATQDRVVFADELNRGGTTLAPERGTFQEVPDANAIFFRPNFDLTRHHEADGILEADKEYLNGGVNQNAVFAAGMRIADCGSLLVELKDKQDDLVLGIVHLTRTNLLPNGHYVHERNGQPVSWVEKVLGDAIDYYGATKKGVRLSLLGSISSDDYVLSFSDDEKREALWPGWHDAGFMELVERGEKENAYKVKYTEMISDQVRSAVKNLGLSSPVYHDGSLTKGVVNTGDRSTGHASNHWSGKRHNLIAEGRDMHIVGITRDNAHKITLLSRYKRMRDKAVELGERAGEYFTDDFNDSTATSNEAEKYANMAAAIKARIDQIRQ